MDAGSWVDCEEDQFQLEDSLCFEDGMAFGGDCLVFGWIVDLHVAVFERSLAEPHPTRHFVSRNPHTTTSLHALHFSQPRS